MGLSDIITNTPLFEKTPNTPELLPHVIAARKNIERCIDSLAMLEKIVIISRLWERSEQQLKAEGVDEYGCKREPVQGWELEWQTQDATSQAYFDRWMEEYDYNQVSPSRIIEYYSSHYEQGFHGAIMSGCVQCWTTFEALSIDLWAEAMNCRPEGALEALSPAARKRARGDDSQGDGAPGVSVKDDKITINLDAFRESGFNLSASMGALLIENRKFSFNKLRDIKFAYICAFGQPALDLFSDKSGDDYRKLLWLEAMRHLIVHRGGVPDKKFCDSVQGHPVLGKLRAGDALNPTTELLSELGSVAVRICAKMTKLVDDWMVASKEGVK